MVLKRTLPSRVPQAGGAAASPQPASASADFEAPLPAAAAAPQPQPEPQPAPQPKVDTSAALAAALAELSAQSVPVAAPAPQPEATAQPQQVVAAEPSFADDEPSLPDANGMRRRVRDKKPRAFASSPAPVTTSAAPVAKATTDYTQSVTSQLDDRLASMGVADKADEGRLPQASAMAEVADTADYLNTPSTPVSLEQEMEPVVAAPVVAPAPAPARQPEPEFETPLAPPAAAAPLADIPPVESDLPWAKPSEPSNDWEFDAPVAPLSDAPAAPVTPPQDIFRGVADTSVQQESSGGVVPPWQLSRNPSLPPPELPLPRKPSFTTSGNGSSTQVFIAGAVVALILFGAYKLVQSDKQQEQVARWTGSLQETTEKLPPEMGGVQPQPDANLIKPEQVIAMQNGVSGSALLPPPADVGQNTMVNVFDSAPAVSSSAVIDFADVPPDQSGKPIVADGSEKMPEDIGFIASLQKAIAAEKAKQGIATTEDGTAAAADPSKPEAVLSQAEKMERGEEMKAKLEEELAAYRRALAGADNPALAPKPTEFFSGDAKKPDPSLLPPPAKGTESVVAATGKADGLPPAELYTNNPGNLPIIPEPTAEEEVKIRELKDFNVELFEPEREKVRVPKGIKPRFATTDFPDLEVLSFVPGRGVIAYANGREGVLLVGESMEGWQLTRVFADRAEFKNGSRNHYLTAE